MVRPDIGQRGALLLVALTLLERPALAQYPLEVCATPTAECKFSPSSLIVTGSPALEPLLKTISDPFRKETGTEIFYVRSVGQCRGAQQVIGDLELSGEVADYLGKTSVHEDLPCCKVPFFRSIQADLWINDSAVEDCFDGKVPAGYRDFQGPIAAYTMVVPRTSAELAITAEEAYFTFAFGSAGWKGMTVAPWVDQNHFMIPGAEFGPQILWAKFLRLPVVAKPGKPPAANLGESVKGRAVAGLEKVVPVLVHPNEANAGGIGLTSAQASDAAANRGAAKGEFRPLAVQAWKQKRAFFPDSTSTAVDKRNVREGRYPFWAPVHIVAKVDETGRVLKDRAESMINYVQLSTDLPGANVLDAIVGARLIPRCAMKVQRAADQPDTGELMPYSPPPGSACGCYMDELLLRGSSGCTPCATTATCPRGKTCSHGYCE